MAAAEDQACLVLKEVTLGASILKPLAQFWLHASPHPSGSALAGWRVWRGDLSLTFSTADLGVWEESPPSSSSLSPTGEGEEHHPSGGKGGRGPWAAFSQTGPALSMVVKVYARLSPHLKRPLPPFPTEILPSVKAGLMFIFKKIFLIFT